MRALPSLQICEPVVVPSFIMEACPNRLLWISFRVILPLEHPITSFLPPVGLNLASLVRTFHQPSSTTIRSMRINRGIWLSKALPSISKLISIKSTCRTSPFASRKKKTGLRKQIAKERMPVVRRPLNRLSNSASTRPSCSSHTRTCSTTR